MKRIGLLIATAFGVLTTPALLAQMNHGGMNHGDHSAQQPGSDARSNQAPALPQPVQAVITNYLRIQGALAQDSLQGVGASAAAIAKAIRSDSSKTFSAEVAQAAEDLAKATDLDASRQVFKRLSGTLIIYLDAHKDQASRFVKVFCPMASATWLQADSTINNPFFGKSMARCGKIIPWGETAASGAVRHEMNGPGHTGMAGCSPGMAGCGASQ